MDLSSLLQWWDEWQLSVLVLGSLGVKCFLAVAAGARKSHIGPVCRFLIWLSYLGGDALAIYALAALLNIQKKAAAAQAASSADGGSRALQLLWAPIMLMHLGGLANISAYNIEDNELWRRHIATSVSQVAVALYVFCKLWSFSADKRLLAAAILLFIPGVFKCLEKPLALRRSSFYNLVSQPAKPNKEPEPSLQECIDRATTASRRPERVDVEKLTKKEPGDVESECWDALSRPDKLFVDLPRTYSERARAAESFWRLDNGAAQHMAGAVISNAFNLLYTKDFTLAKMRRGEHPLDLLCSFSTWVLSLLVPVAAIGLLHSGRTEAYRGSDVKITFLLLYVTLLVDACSIASLGDSPWHGMVAQHNLMALFARNRRRLWVTAVAGNLGCTELLGHQFLFRMKPCPSYSSSSRQQGGGITRAVRRHVHDGWAKHITDDESYSSFCDMRGQWTREALTGSLETTPFDETVLVWHLATDLYRSLSGRNDNDKPAASSSSSSSPPPIASDPENNKDGGDGDATLATHISNYMMHLLFANPEMLMPGSRTYLCTAAYQGIEAIFHDAELEAAEKEKEKRKSAPAVAADRSSLGRQQGAGGGSELCTLAYRKVKAIFSSKQQQPPQEEGRDAAVVADRLRGFLSNHPELLPANKVGNNAAAVITASSEQVEEGKGFVYATWELARALEGLRDRDLAWSLIRGVWVEMLCFSAIRCRGFLHAKSLGSGGEYLTFVWLLMAHSGLETFPERQQRPRAMRTANGEQPAAAKQAA